MGSRCYDCGEKFGRCYEHSGNECPSGCNFGKHDCPGSAWGEYSASGPDLIREVPLVAVTDPDTDW